jgi:hypothetical protein
MMKSLLTLAFIVFASFVFGQRSYLYCDTLIDTPAGTVQKELTIIIEKNKIIDGFYNCSNPILYNVLTGLLSQNNSKSASPAAS